MANVSPDSRLIIIIRVTSRDSQSVIPKKCNHIQTRVIVLQGKEAVDMFMKLLMLKKPL